ncbi:MAG: DUF2339 domain-containing protein [Actinomycetia bacterium]|nr:DUF2339 domain-containing protein [Actinomycetes bacterium]
MPQQQHSAQKTRKLEKAPSHRINVTESWIGRNVLGIAASVLIFIGLIFLGSLIYRHITDGMKIAALFAISAAVTGLGVFLSRRKRNTFTVILTGTGCGAFYISVLLTNLYFHRLDQIVALIILLVWLVATLFVAKKLNSVSISVIAHVGMVLALCFAFARPLYYENLVPLIVYQMASIAVIVAGNILCCRETYRFGLFASLALTLVASGTMLYRVIQHDPLISTAVMIAVFTVQFLCASFLSYLLAISTSRLKSIVLQYVLHLANKALWTTALVLNVYWVAYRLVSTGNLSIGVVSVALSAVFAATVASLVVLILHASLSIFMGQKLKFQKRLQTISVLMASGVAGVFLSIWYGAQILHLIAFPQLSWFIGLALLLMIARRVSHNNAYLIAALVFLVLDVATMLFYGYSQLNHYGTIALSLAYLLGYLALIWAWWLRRSKADRDESCVAVRLTSYLLVEASLASILLTSGLHNRGLILMICLLALNLVLFMVRYEGPDHAENDLFVIMRVHKLSLVLIAAVLLVVPVWLGGPAALYLALFVLAFMLALVRIKEHLFGPDINAVEEALIMLELSVLILSGVYALSASSESRVVLMLLTSVTLGIVFYLLRMLLYRHHGRSVTDTALDRSMRGIEAVLLFMTAVCLASSQQIGGAQAVYVVLFALALGLALIRIKPLLLSDKIDTMQEILCMLELTALIMGGVYSLAADSLQVGVFLLMTLTALGIVFYVARYQLYRYHKRSLTDSRLDIVLRIIEILIVGAALRVLVVEPRINLDASPLLLMGVSALALGLAFMRVQDLFAGKMNLLEQVLMGVKLTGITLATAYGPIGLTDPGYGASLIGMLTALVCVAVGFVSKAKVLRLYGVILTLVCVLKLVTYDVSGQTTILRVAAFISGGVICFAISAIYSYSVRKVDAALPDDEKVLTAKNDRR